MDKEKKIKKHYETIYCSLPVRVKEFLKKFTPSLRKDIISRALFFYFTQGFYKELFPLLTEEELSRIEQEIFEIYKIRPVSKKKLSKKDNISNKEKKESVFNVSKTENKKNDNMPEQNKIENKRDNQDITSSDEKKKENDVNLDFSTIDDSIIDEFDY